MSEHFLERDLAHTVAAAFPKQKKVLLHFCAKFHQYLSISKLNDDMEAGWHLEIVKHNRVTLLTGPNCEYHGLRIQGRSHVSKFNRRRVM